VDAHIPPEYIRGHGARLDVYRRAAAVEDDGDAAALFDELADRFGDPPPTVVNLLEIARIKALAKALRIREIGFSNGRALFYFKGAFDMKIVAALIGKFRGAILLNAGEKPYFSYRIDEKGKAVPLSDITILLQSYKRLQSEEKSDIL
jgi:transcription-repair coupling factor (superfamily II helicase)